MTLEELEQRVKALEERNRQADIVVAEEFKKFMAGVSGRSSLEIG